jgi:hypothetical protein
MAKAPGQPGKGGGFNLIDRQAKLCRAAMAMPGICCCVPASAPDSSHHHHTHADAGGAWAVALDIKGNAVGGKLQQGVLYITWRRRLRRQLLLKPRHAEQITPVLLGGCWK